MLSFLTDLINENMEWTEIKTNDKMNQTLKDCLEMQKDNISLYARKYIEELECEVKKLSKADVIKSVCDRCEGKPESADNVLCSDCYSDLHGM